MITDKINVDSRLISRVFLNVLTLSNKVLNFKLSSNEETIAQKYLKYASNLTEQSG